jgi:hypothetical protein
VRALIATVLAGILLALALVIALALVSGGVIGVAIIIVPVVAVSVVASVAALVFKQSAGEAAGLAGRVSLGLAGVLGVAGAFLVKGAGPSCDAFCFTRTEAAIIVLVAAVSYGLLVALGAALLTSIIVGATRRPTTSR